MGTQHLPRNKQGRLAEPSLAIDENTDGAVSLLEENALRGDEPSLWGDEHSDDLHSLLEEEAGRRSLTAGRTDYHAALRALPIAPVLAAWLNSSSSSPARPSGVGARADEVIE